MPREQKIGLTLLILAIGLAGAFCFRRPGPEQAALPGLPGEDKINRQLADLRTRPLLPGIDLSSPNVPPLKPSEQLVQELAGLPISRLSERADRYAPPPISTLHDLRESQRTETPPSDPRQIRRSAELSPSAERPHGSPLTPTISRGQPSGSGSRNPFDTATLPSEQIHEVQVGETLTGIAVRYLGSASRYQEIYEANTHVLPSPNLLRPGMKLKIPPRVPVAPSRVPIPQELGPAIEPPPPIKEAHGGEVPAVSWSLSPFDEANAKPASHLDNPFTQSEGSLEDPVLRDVQAQKLFVPARRTPFMQPSIPEAERLAEQPETTRR